MALSRRVGRASSGTGLGRAAGDRRRAHLPRGEPLGQRRCTLCEDSDDQGHDRRDGDRRLPDRALRHRRLRLPALRLGQTQCCFQRSGARELAGWLHLLWSPGGIGVLYRLLSARGAGGKTLGLAGGQPGTGALESRRADSGVGPVSAVGASTPDLACAAGLRALFRSRCRGIADHPFTPHDPLAGAGISRRMELLDQS